MEIVQLGLCILQKLYKCYDRGCRRRRLGGVGAAPLGVETTPPMMIFKRGDL